MKTRPSLPSSRITFFPSHAVLHQPPPDGYAIAFTSDGVFYPLLVSSSTQPGARQAQPAGRRQPVEALVALRWEWEAIPFSQGTFPTQGLVACASWEEALAWCERRRENSDLLSGWDALAARCELFPERNAYYDEHIHLLLSQANMQVLPPGICICPLHRSVCAWLTCLRRGKEQKVFAEADTIDAAWEALYLQVWQWAQNLGYAPGRPGP